jgi:Mrp family chromosome partitioning ATPase
VGIVASEASVASGWAEHAALTLAKVWTDAGRKVMLVDGSLHRPSLHTASGIVN